MQSKSEKLSSLKLGDTNVTNRPGHLMDEIAGEGKYCEA